ncbi:MAG: hypothetical protein EZS28_051084, partial [Streblomastix strix]
MRVMLSVVVGVMKKVCEVYCAMGLCILGLCLGLLSLHLLLDLFPFAIVVDGIVIERNQQQRQSQRSISPPHKKAEESGDDQFLEEVIPGMKMPHLPPHMSDIETAQRTWQNRGYDLVRDPSVIKYKNSKWHSKLATQKPFTFRDWREFWADAGFSLEQINIPHYLSKEYKSQSPHDKSRRNESIRIYEKE